MEHFAVQRAGPAGAEQEAPEGLQRPVERVRRPPSCRAGEARAGIGSRTRCACRRSCQWQAASFRTRITETGRPRSRSSPSCTIRLAGGAAGIGGHHQRQRPAADQAGSPPTPRSYWTRCSIPFSMALRPVPSWGCRLCFGDVGEHLSHGSAGLALRRQQGSPSNVCVTT